MLNTARSSHLKPITKSRFRANPSYKLIAFQDLPVQEKRQFSQPNNQPNLYGFLYPLEFHGLGVKSVCHQTAELYNFLRTPSFLPESTLQSLGQDANQSISQLVLDGVIEIESEERFVSGPTAHSIIYAPEIENRSLNRITDISYAALRYAQSLNLKDSHLLSSRLYFYNRVPASPYWQKRLSNDRDVTAFLSIHPGTQTHNILQQHWQQHANNAWMSWSSRTAKLGHSSQVATYKLYISPTCEALPETFSRLVSILTEMDVPHFKIGKDLYGLLRPDKIVTYFSSFQSLEATAQKLSTALAGTPAQGVPFTSSWDSDGLLSWGMDPPQTEATPLGQERESWRLWITNQLAVALFAAQQDPSRTVEPWKFALDRLSLKGIDISNWTPNSSLWRNSKTTHSNTVIEA